MLRFRLHTRLFTGQTFTLAIRLLSIMFQCRAVQMLVGQAFRLPLPFPHFVRLLANPVFATGIGGRLIPGALMPLF